MVYYILFDNNNKNKKPILFNEVDINRLFNKFLITDYKIKKENYFNQMLLFKKWLSIKKGFDPDNSILNEFNLS